mmetsp:Transcript_73812/g.175714  ORF Transcript_73812/g.175714 Transcript_73812/m.175714 type:complete len:97 (+) Transcript_73812:94-384(+)|eukprot:CAMPEP_0178442498 /NCGR_PEP_ID=MMETSP0689_2-20121128/38206_1 /TAXON_ID=160604 /ORGANISM="Amphidinium massartii, Strain CS-259" /LENGTH=96 /DNA_ID=CAMNT_0020066067 /DNA_START=77 /DNA_END=367 /DNA_ORIENTATION=-
MANRSGLLSILFVALALFSGFQAFVGSTAPSTSTSLRASVATRAVPVEAIDAVGSSMNTALTVQTAGWWANIFFVVIPCGFLVTLYLQSERSKLEE